MLNNLSHGDKGKQNNSHKSLFCVKKQVSKIWFRSSPFMSSTSQAILRWKIRFEAQMGVRFKTSYLHIVEHNMYPSKEGLQWDFTTLECSSPWRDAANSLAVPGEKWARWCSWVSNKDGWKSLAGSDGQCFLGFLHKIIQLLISDYPFK